MPSAVLTPRVRIRIEEYTPSPRTSGTIKRKTVPQWIVAQGEVHYYEAIKRKLDDIWVHRHADAQLSIVECCYDSLHDEFYLCQDRAALATKFEVLRPAGEAGTVTRDELAARLRCKGKNILAFFFNCMTILTKARRSFYLAREAMDVTPVAPAPMLFAPFLRPLYDLLAPPSTRHLVFYTLICNPMEQRLRKHMARYARRLRALSPPPPSHDGGESSSMDEIDLSDHYDEDTD